MKVLVVQGSPNLGSPQGSLSEEISKKFISNFVELHPEAQIEYLDLNKDAAGTNVLTSDNIGHFFGSTDKYIKQLKSVDKLILVAPVVNFIFATTIKNYLDHILVAKQTFEFAPNESGEIVLHGLLKHLDAFIISSQGSPANGQDTPRHISILEDALGFTGVNVKGHFFIAGADSGIYGTTNKIEIVEKHAAEIKDKAALL